MATFTKENAPAWNALFASVGENRPSVGKQVKVSRGRKHRGVTGTVVWHGQDTYYFAAHGRYMSDAQLALSEARGTTGYRVGIKTAEGITVFVNAEYVECLV